MKGPDLDRERSEKLLSLKDFLKNYNEDLPSQFPRASTKLLNIFRAGYPGSFKSEDGWSLDQHRKKVMDWLPGYLRANNDSDKPSTSHS